MAELTNFQELLKELRLPSSIKIPQGWTQVQALQNWLQAIDNDKFATFKVSDSTRKKIQSLKEPKDGIDQGPTEPTSAEGVLENFDKIFE